MIMRAVDFQIDPEADVAIARLENADLSGMSVFPVFQNPSSDPRPGTSLCRLGFPFVQVTAAFDDVTGRFTLQNFAPPPMFPNDGIHTRIMIAPDPAKNRSVKFIETSTPGFMGQSGGPLFDVEGQVWGIQYKTSFLELGFSPKKQGRGQGDC
jgi:S1-C subfamily serine protease